MKRAIAFLFVIPLACAAPEKDARVDALGPPIGPDDPQARFAAVANAMVYKCGTLDCHGNNFRNMRLYGYGGLRAAPGQTSDAVLLVNGTKFAAATPEEVTRDYDAIVGLEPTIMNDVVRSNGADPERLVLIRKARATENHKGGPVMKPGDSMDVCLTSWLASKVNVDECKAVRIDLGALPPPPTP